MSTAGPLPRCEGPLGGQDVRTATDVGARIRTAGPLPRCEDSANQVMEATQRWLERAVIGLNLCPFAKAVHVKGLIHTRVSDARDAEAFALDLHDELLALVRVPDTERDNTLLVAPHCLQDFLDFNDFLDVADRMLEELGLDGVLQIASLHPRYQFAGTEFDDVTNCTNRSPYPTLHLLREDSVARAVQAFPDPDSIPDVNIKTMERLGLDGWRRLFSDAQDHAPAPESGA